MNTAEVLQVFAELEEDIKTRVLESRHLGYMGGMKLTLELVHKAAVSIAESYQHSSPLIAAVWWGDRDKHQANAIFLADGTKISITREGGASWMEVGPPRIVAAQEKECPNKEIP